MTRILVTGSSGQLGSEIKELSVRFSGYDFQFTDNPELNITDPEATITFINDFSPAWIINCAAYTAVDKAEEEEALAALVNRTGVENIVKAIGGTQCRLVQISTDYVFDGTSTIPYTEEDRTSPISAYGRTKLAGEIAALSWPFAMVIRTSWLYSSYGQNFVKTILQKAGSSDGIDVVADQTGSPTYAADLASAILEIISGTIQNRHIFIPGVFNYSGEGHCSRYDLAIEVIAASGYDCRVNAVRSNAYPSKVRRPSFSVLDNSKIKETYNISIPHWRVSLNSCISKINMI